MEEHILQKMGFDLCVPTFMDFVFAYLHYGVASASDQMDASEVEARVMKRAKEMLFRGTFMMFPPEMVAVSVLH